MSGRGAAPGSRYLYAPFDAANARIDANERVLEERLHTLTFRLDAIEKAILRLERRLWLAVFGVVSVVLAEVVKDLIFLNVAG